VCGVCRTKSPTIYGHKSINFFGIARNVAVKVIDIDYAKTLYPSLAGVTIEKGHCLRSNNYGDVTFDLLKIDDRFDDIPYDLIINPEDYLTIKYRPCSYRHDFYISTDGSDSTIQEVTKLINNTITKLESAGIGVEIKISNAYQEQYDEAVADSKNMLNSTEIMGAVLGAVALLLIILSTYLSMLNQISDIAVYRSLGYSRFFLGMTYFMELLMLALIYCVIGGGLTFLTMFLLDAIPLVEFSLVTPFVYFITLPLALALLISLIGIIPIMMVFKLTPANIYNRYNRRITGE
jgi:ABC-type antimicrobial peptide transport system permease subunit